MERKNIRLLKGREVIEIYRRPFKFNVDNFLARGNWREKIPAGFELQRVDESIAEQAHILGSWKSFDDFMSNGIGYALHGWRQTRERMLECFRLVHAD